jgi:hypothetical protein
LGRLFLVRFWGFITHDFIAFDFELTGRQHESFSAGDGMVPAGSGIVNDASAPPGGWQCESPARGRWFSVTRGEERMQRLVKDGFEYGLTLTCKWLGINYLHIKRQNSYKKSIAIPRKGGMVKESGR